MNKKLIILFFITFLFNIGFGQNLLLLENFNYPVGDSIVNSIANYGWTAHSARNINPLLVTSPGLTFPGYISSGIGNAVTVTGGSSSREDANKVFTEQTSGNVYVSFMVNVSSAPLDTLDYFLHLGPTPIGNIFRGRVFVRRDASNNLSFGLSKGAATGANVIKTDFNYSFNTTYLIVLKYSIISGSSNDSVSLFIFTGAIPTTEPTTPTIGPAGDAAQSDINPGTIALRQGGLTYNVKVDGIRVADSWLEAPLPVQLSSFIGYFLSNNSVKLEWETISEINNFGFYVEKLNPITNIFTTIEESFQPGAGSSLEPRKYSWIDENANGENLQYRLRQVDTDGLESYFGPIMLNPTSVKNPEVVPGEFRLNQNYPNPFNPKTNISFTVAKSGYTTLKVYNVLGNEITTLFNTIAEPGKEYILEFDASKLSSGIYYYQLSNSNQIQTRKMLLMK